MTIGIVTLSFNQARWLPEAFDSIHRWQKTPVSHIVVDPGSTDGSRNIISEWAPRCSGLILEPDRGPADGLNKGFAALDTDILGYLNADDRFCPGAIDYVAHFFERNPEVDILLGAIRIIDGAGRAARRIRRPDPFSVRRHVYGACFVYQQATFFRASTFHSTPGFNLANRSCWDSELLVDMALAGARFTRTGRILGDFRLHSESLTGSGTVLPLLRLDMARIRDRVVHAGVTPMSRAEATFARMTHRLSVRRHLANLIYEPPAQA
ncbi:MAG: glycosyltransferase [Bryobacteraceae bacterium]